MPYYEDDTESVVVTKRDTKTRKPRRYKVILHNDDYTAMDFVTDILETIFHKPPQIAAQIMLEIHRKGSGICGVYSKEVAESKVRQVENEACNLDQPLLCTMEPE